MCGRAHKQEPRHFILSVEEGAAILVRLAKIGREHGSVENKNHWRCEDLSVRRKPKGTKKWHFYEGGFKMLANI